MNELLFRYQVAGDLANSVFALIHAGNFSAELNEQLEKTYALLIKEQKTLYEKVRKQNEGV